MRISLKGEEGMKVIFEEYPYSLSIKMLCVLPKIPNDMEGNMSYRVMNDGRCFCRSIVFIPNGFIYDLVTYAMKDKEYLLSITEWFNRIVYDVKKQRNSNIAKLT